MPLVCSCPDYDDDCEWYWHSPDDYTMLSGARRKRCSSCGELVDLGAVCISFERTRGPKDDIEEKIHGDDWEAVALAPYYMCEPCGDLYFSFQELGYCVQPDEDMRELVKEYAELHKESKTGEKDEQKRT